MSSVTAGLASVLAGYFHRFMPELSNFCLSVQLEISLRILNGNVWVELTVDRNRSFPLKHSSKVTHNSAANSY